MTSTDEVQEMLKQAEKEADNDTNIYQETARMIVNIERQSYYGDESPRARLALIRERIVDASKRFDIKEALDEN